MNLTLTFGPSRSVGFARALRLSRQWFHPVQVEAGRWAVVIELDTASPRGRYVRAEKLLALVGAWATTEVEVDGEPEFGYLLRQMSRCAADWLQVVGRCRERYPDGEPWARCSSCPLAAAREVVPDFPPAEWGL